MILQIIHQVYTEIEHDLRWIDFLSSFFISMLHGSTHRCPGGHPSEGAFPKWLTGLTRQVGN